MNILRFTLRRLVFYHSHMMFTVMLALTIDFSKGSKHEKATCDFDNTFRSRKRQDFPFDKTWVNPQLFTALFFWRNLLGKSSFFIQVPYEIVLQGTPTIYNFEKILFLLIIKKLLWKFYNIHRKTPLMGIYFSDLHPGSLIKVRFQDQWVSL